MPRTKPKPSEIALQNKTDFIPPIVARYPQLIRSIVYPDTKDLRVSEDKSRKRKLRIAMVEGDLVDVALSWHDSNCSSGLVEDAPGIIGSSIPIVCAANDNRAGGEWETNIVAPEECLSRRSTLVQALTTPYETSYDKSPYPMNARSGIYSPSVVIFRSGPDQGYCIWKRHRYLPVISVAPIRRPKLTDPNTKYSFGEERELMKDQMRGTMRIAAENKHTDVVIGAFGFSPGFKNPPGEVAGMWKEILFDEPEFKGVFCNVVFAFQNIGQFTSEDGLTGFEVFGREFDPANIVKTSYRD